MYTVPLLIGLAVVLALGCGLAVYEHFAGQHPLFDALYEWRLRRRDLGELDRRNLANARTVDVVVSLTTLPSRIDRIVPTIKSLLNQSVRPKTIRLNVPAISRREGRPYVIPEWLRRLQSITVCTSDDFGPATKLIPTLADVPPDQIIVVVDDDRIYQPYLIEQFAAHAAAYPDAAIGASGWEAPADLIDRPSTLGAVLGGDPPVPLHCTRVGKGREVDMVRGASGYLVRPRFFDPDALRDYSAAPEAAFFVDDVWISAHCRARKLVLPGRRTNFSSLADTRFFDASSLGRINCTGPDASRNNTIMLQYFADRWRVRQSART